MKTGDIIEFSSPEIPLPYLQAVVIDANNPEYLDVMSTLLVPFQHSGKLNWNTTTIHGVVCPAEQAIPRETGFNQGEVIGCHLGVGSVIAGFDGVVVVRRGDGQLMTGGRKFFERVAD